MTSRRLLLALYPAILGFGFLTTIRVSANVTMPHVFGSHMVLQRDQPLPFWGWAEAGEKVSVQIGDQPSVTATANATGEWRVDLPKMNAGGPYTLKVTGKNGRTAKAQTTDTFVRSEDRWLLKSEQQTLVK